MKAALLRRLPGLAAETSFSEILTGSVWAMSARVLATALAMTTSIITARFYGAEIMGIVATINAFLGLATTFTLMGTSTSILRLIPEHMAKYSPGSAHRIYRKVLFLIAGTGLIAGVILFVASPFIAGRIYSKPQFMSFFAAASVFVVFMSLGNLNTQSVRSLKLVRTFAFMQLLSPLCRLLVLLLLTSFWFRPINPVCALFSSLVITAVAGTLIVETTFRRKIGIHDKIHDIPVRVIASLSLPMLMTSAMGLLIGQASVIVLGMFRPVAEVGYYDVAVKMSTLTTFLLQAVNVIAAPKFSELYYAGRIDDLFRAAHVSAKLIFWSTIPILLTLVAIGNPLLSLLYGRQFTASYTPMLLLLFGQFVNAASGSTGYFMNMIGHEKALRNIMLVAGLTNVFTNVLVVPHYGVVGAALACSISLIFWNSCCLLFVKIKYNHFIGYLPFLRSSPRQ
ncbi:Membrane protein involved in the export of O-antigen and teichoic acid [Desulfacinum hydrothermale DSM 13146]|uniref:Membrane protein involved in the export of O-antigen and teichoic acid n=1 Tax=Desulfacinum hydrothermale DSM 13146 TaxID=1121390 RepID=A0A1W1XS33_9BACT|nr:flippase [Desulfacinum hydrothermale]SMC26706.1 Membrane protein involved in the export of O-antigen and teichoic acid [Desulfacinum hydrothermale DSM 13146]